MAYFERMDGSTYRPTDHVSGAWNTAEQHIAPALGLLVHLVEAHRDDRRDDGLSLARLSFDILGTVGMEEFSGDVAVTRPGRTIELVEATLVQGGRPAVVLRAWLMQRADTAEVAGGDLPQIAAPARTPAWDPTTAWPGGFIASVELRREQERPGRARFWVRTDVPLLADVPVSDTASTVGLFDIANGMTVREDPTRVLFPNVDLTAHLFREPRGGWVGFDTTVTFGPDGRGITSSVVHDEDGPFGTCVQSLTVRP